VKVEKYFEVYRVSEFEKDMKKLKKKYRTLEDDLKNFLGTQVFLHHKLNKDNQGVFLISGLGIERHNVYKAKKFACRSLSGTGVKS
jgi:hypothetical protein